MGSLLINQNRKTTAAYWDNWWYLANHPPIRDSDPQYGHHGYFMRAVERHVGPLNGKHVLELGGAFSYRLASMAKYRKVAATMIDYSDVGVTGSVQFFAANGCDVVCLYGDFFSLPKGMSFDVVTHWGVLEHELEPDLLIKRSVELTASGGWIMFSMPQMRGPAAWLWKRYSPESWKRHMYHTDEAIIGCFRRLGWHCKPVFWGEPTLYISGGENQGLMPYLARTLQRGISFSARFHLPYQCGLPFISQNRGFVANAM